MEKIYCFVFILIMSVCSAIMFKYDRQDILSDFEQSQICVVVEDDVEGVKNGNLTIVPLKSISEIGDYNYKGITFRLKDFNVKRFIKEYDVKITKKYNINDIQIIEGRSDKLNSIDDAGSVQIAITSKIVTVGFPMILDSF